MMQDEMSSPSVDPEDRSKRLSKYINSSQKDEAEEVKEAPTPQFQNQPDMQPFSTGNSDLNFAVEPAESSPEALE